MKLYLAVEHVAPTASSDLVAGPVDGRLAQLGFERNIQVTVPEFSVAPFVLLSTNLIFTGCCHFAEHYSSTLPVTSVLAPNELNEMRFYLL